MPGQPSVEAWGTGLKAATDWTIGPDGALWWVDESIGGFRVHRIAYRDSSTLDSVADPWATDRGIYDVQGRRVAKSRPHGVYFRRGGKKRSVLE